MIVGKCPYCDDGVVSYTTKDIQGRKTKLYACSNNKVTTEDGEVWEQTSPSNCKFKIFGNALQRWGCKFIGPKQVKKLLNHDDTIVHLYSYHKKIKYQKYIELNYEYGISVLWDIDIDEYEINKAII